MRLYRILILLFFVATSAIAKDFALPAPVTSGVETAHGIYLGTHNGLVKLNGESLLSLRDAGIDVGRVRSIQQIDNDKVLVGGDGLWLVDLAQMSSVLLFERQVKTFALAGDSLLLQTDYAQPELLLFTFKNRSLSAATTVPLHSRLKSLFSVNNTIYALTESGLKKLEWQRLSSVYDGQFRAVYASNLNLVLAEKTNLHVFSFSLNSWSRIELSFEPTAIKKAIQPDLAWVRASDKWHKISLVTGKGVDYVSSTTQFLFEHRDGLVTQLNDRLYIGKTSAHIDADKQPAVPAAAMEPAITVVRGVGYGSGRDGIYQLSTGKLVQKVKGDILSLFSHDGEQFYVGLTDGLLDADGSRYLNVSVNALTRYKLQMYVATQDGLYTKVGSHAPVRVEQIDEPIFALKIMNSQLFALGMNSVYRIQDDEVHVVTTLKDALFTDALQTEQGLLFVSYNFGIYHFVDDELEQVSTIQSRYVSLIKTNEQIYALGREGICQFNTDHCIPLTSDITAANVVMTETGAYTTSPAGIWPLDLNFANLAPTLNYLVLDNKPVVQRHVSINAGDTVTFVFNKQNGFAELNGETYPLYNGTVTLAVKSGFSIGNFDIAVQRSWGWFYVLLGLLIGIGLCCMALKRYHASLISNFAEMCRDKRKNDAIRSAITSVDLLCKSINKNDELSLADAAYLTDELADALVPMRLSARLRPEDDLMCELTAAMINVKYAHNMLSAKIGKIDQIPAELKPDSYEALLRMVSVAIDVLKATEVTVDILHDDGVLLCVQHNGQPLSALRQVASTNMHLIVAKHIGSLYAEPLLFSPNEINLTLREKPERLDPAMDFGKTSVSQIF